MISAEKMLLQQEALKNIRNLEEEIKKNETLINESILKRNPLLSTIKGTMSNLAICFKFTKALAPTAGL